MSQSAATIQAYLKRGKQLWLCASSTCGLDPVDMTPAAFLVWLEAKLPTLQPASRRQYIASSKQFLLRLRDIPHLHQMSRKDLDVAIQQSMQMQSAQYTPTGNIKKSWRGKTSSQKSKKLNISDIATLSNQANNLRGKWIKPAILWLTANMLVGLRPSEWRYAQLNMLKESIILQVINAKFSNGRANGEKRHIDLTGLNPVELKLVKLQINVASYHASDEASWNRYYSGIRKAIHRITRTTLPNQRKYPTLYSSRHQFAANAKSAGMNKVEIAALMGHAVDTTAGSHYGKKKHGSGSCRVKASMTEMASVRVKSPMIKKMQKSIRSHHGNITNSA